MKKYDELLETIKVAKDLGYTPEQVMKRLDALETDVSDLKDKIDNPDRIKKQFAALGGKAKSEAKQRAARENGKKGWPLPQKAGEQ